MPQPEKSSRKFEDTAPADSSGSEHEPRKRKRASRWGADETDKVLIPGLPTVIPANMTKEQERGYILQLRIEEITRCLRFNDLGIPERVEDRSPSPEPVYDSTGKRQNTREIRVRERLDAERHKLVTEMLAMNPLYKPPADYKVMPTRHTDKVFIPQEDHPDINFVGLIIGPRGNTLKMLEKDSGAKIIIRGRGSVKDGKIGAKNGQPLPGEDEPLHAYVQGASLDVVQKACDKIREIVRQGIEVPECMNDLRRQQLRELALLNGTLRENDTLTKLKLLATAEEIVTNKIVCSHCGGTGHITSDCKLKKEGQPATWAEREKYDTEYQTMMAELGQGPAPDMAKIGDKARSIVSRNGVSDMRPLAIEANKGGSSGLTAPSSSSNLRRYEAFDSDDYSPSAVSSSNSNSPSVVAPVLREVGVVEDVVDGRKVIDFTRLSTSKANRARYQQLQEEHATMQQLVDYAEAAPDYGAQAYDPAMMAAYHQYYAASYAAATGYAAAAPWPTTAYPGWPPMAAAPPPPPPPPPPPAK